MGELDTNTLSPPPEHPWPTAWKPRLDGSSSVVGVGIAIVALLLSFVAHVSIWIAGLLIVFALLVAFFRAALVSAASTVGVAWCRIWHYDQLYEYAKDREADVQTERFHVESLVQKLVAQGREPGLAIVLSWRVGTETQIVIERRVDRPLRPGQVVLIADPPTNALLATFRVIREVAEGYVAAPESIRADGGLWWAYTRSRAEAHARLETVAVAVPVE